MKAYLVYERGWEGREQIIVYAENVKEARNKGREALEQYDEFLNIRAERASYMDDTEEWSILDKWIRLLEHGWYYEYDYKIYNEDNLGEFLGDAQNGDLILKHI